MKSEGECEIALKWVYTTFPREIVLLDVIQKQQNISLFSVFAQCE